MSGGEFDYIQFKLDDVTEQIQDIIKKNTIPDAYGYKYNYSEATINEFKNGIKTIKKAIKYIERIDWLVSGDDSEEGFHKLLKITK